MSQETITFNDLPQVVSFLLREVRDMKQLLVSMQENKEKGSAPTDTHTPMSVEEASAYLKMPVATLYMKLGNGTIPATKPGKRYCLYRDELDKWLEANRKNAVPMTADEENDAITPMSTQQAMRPEQQEHKVRYLQRIRSSAVHFLPSCV